MFLLKFLLRVEKVTIFAAYKYFATKLCKFSNFKMLFLAVSKDMPRSNLVCYKNCPFHTKGYRELPLYISYSKTGTFDNIFDP